MSLGLNDDIPIGALAPESRHKSAGLAFGLSLLIPGAGQFYCGKTARGGTTLGFWLVGLVLCFSHVSPLFIGQALVVMLVLWIFSFLDAYFTATEINRGQDEVVDVQNPRVAVTLNLLTAGFGYFYLGERTKGIALFIAMQVLRWVVPSTGVLGLFTSLTAIVVQTVAAFDAYRVAREQVQEALGPEAAQPVVGTAPPSRLPATVPIVLACVLGFGFVVLAVIGLAVGAGRKGKQPTTAASLGRRPSVRPPSRYPPPARDTGPIKAVDMLSAVQDVQRVQRESVRTKGDIPYLKQDVAMLGSVLIGIKVLTADHVVARYYRALGLAFINMVHEREGDAMDASAARMALADLDKIVKGPSIGTYVPEVNAGNAEYWAGIIARNQLHQEKEAYAHWEKCAWQTHAGCMHNLAGARITGEGGEKVDVQDALKLHTTAYNSGTKFHCAGAMSAMSIANINYFENVRRPGDDELEWTKKADELFDKLEMAEGNRNVCHRADVEVDEFLFQLGHGHRDDNILQDAVSRLDDDSNSTKAVIQFISGAIDGPGFESVVQADKSEGHRCSAYFDAMWYAELHNEEATARRYYQRLVDIGKFHCGQHLVYADKFKF